MPFTCPWQKRRASNHVIWWRTQASQPIQIRQVPSSTSSLRGPLCGFQAMPAFKQKSSDASSESKRRQPIEGAIAPSLAHRLNQLSWRHREGLLPPVLEVFVREQIPSFRQRRAMESRRRQRQPARKHFIRRVAIRTSGVDTCVVYVSNRDRVVISSSIWVHGLFFF